MGIRLNRISKYIHIETKTDWLSEIVCDYNGKKQFLMYGHHLCNRLQIYSRSESGLWNCKREDAFYRDLRHAFCEVIHSCIYICHEFVVQLRSDRSERLLLTSCTMNTVLLAAVYDFQRFKLTSDQKPRIVFKPFLTRNWKWTSLFALSLSSWFSCMKWVSSEKKTEAPLFFPRQPKGLSDVFNAILIRITLFCLLKNEYFHSIHQHLRSQ